MKLLEGRPEIDYPSPWTFKIIGQEEDDIRQAVATIVEGQAYELTFSNQSTRGKYCSLNLDMVVVDEPHRLNTFQALMQHDSIQIVL